MEKETSEPLLARAILTVYKYTGASTDAISQANGKLIKSQSINADEETTLVSDLGKNGEIIRAVVPLYPQEANGPISGAVAHPSLSLTA